eukprot:366323-Chlamydomonas_euryale.AAC.5
MWMWSLEGRTHAARPLPWAACRGGSGLRVRRMFKITLLGVWVPCINPKLNEAMQISRSVKRYAWSSPRLRGMLGQHTCPQCTGVWGSPFTLRMGVGCV